MTHEEIAGRLLASGANPNVGHPVSGPPLLHAAAWGEGGIIRLLISNGAEVNATDAKRFTALHYACFCGQVRFAKHSWQVFFEPLFEKRMMTRFL